MITYYVIDALVLLVWVATHEPVPLVTALLRAIVIASGALAATLAVGAFAAPRLGLSGRAHRSAALAIGLAAGVVGTAGVIGLANPSIDPYPVADAAFFVGLAVLVIVAAIDAMLPESGQ